MKKRFFGSILIIIIVLTAGGKVFSQDISETSIKKMINNTGISGLYFMTYSYDNEAQLQKFSVKRGYFTLKTKINDIFSVRYTQDITLDKEGGDKGNVEIRLKYLYLKTNLDIIPFLKHTYIETGLVHRPWFDLEQHINQYRIQGKMFLDRNRLATSADFGIVYMGLIGGKINSEYRENVNPKEAGKYGSFAFGVYNGGGYHAIENNSNKIFESRLSIRPFPNFLPGLQLSHGFSYGSPNLTKNHLKFMMNVGMLSSESAYHKFTAQYTKAYGNFSGRYYFPESIENTNFKEDDPYNSEGFSFFGELRHPRLGFALFARYDNFTLYREVTENTQTYIAGTAYRFIKNKIVVDYQLLDHPQRGNVQFFEIALEIGF